MPETGESPYRGRLIGPYRLQQRIGEGGMGEVYLAEREDEFRQRVAIKLIRPGMASPEVVRRFLIERQTLAALHHPNIVRLVDGGADDGLPYLVVDYVEGTPIDRYCDDQKLNISGRLKLFVEVCMAVHHAHQSLIVHCDLKPSNILVTAEGSPRLLDFGIAKLLDPGSLGISAFSAMTRQRAFTPEYASPEQVRGEPVTTATDIYALGVVLYELLTGHSPHRVPSTGSLADWVRSICEQEADAPSTAIHRTKLVEATDDQPAAELTPQAISLSREGDPHSIERRLRGDLDAIVLKALRKDAGDRYGSVDQLAEDIRRHLFGRPVLARRNTTGYVTRKFLQRHKLAVVAAALILLTLAGGLGATLWESRVAERRFGDVRRLAHTFLFDVHDSVQDLPGSTPARELIAKTGAEYLDRLARDSRGDPSLQLELAEGYSKIGDVEGNPYGGNLGNPSKSLESYRKGLAIARGVLAKEPADRRARQIVAQIVEGLGIVLAVQGKGTEALGHIQEAVKLRQAVSDSEPRNAEWRLDLSRAFEDEGDILGGAQSINLGRRDEAEALYQKALSQIPELRAGDTLAVRAIRAKAILLSKQADIERRGNAQQALAKYQSAVDTAEALTKIDPNSTRAQSVLTALLNKLAYTEGSLGDRAGAQQHYKRAWELNEAALDADPNNQKARTNVVITLKNLGDLYYYEANMLPQALVCYQRAAHLLEEQARADPGNIVWQQNLSEIVADMGSIELATGHPAEGKGDSQRALSIAKAVADHPGATGDQIYNYAWLAATVDPEELRDFRTALPYAIKSAELSKNQDPLRLHVLAQIYAGIGNYTSAAETEGRALALYAPVEAGKPVPRNQANSQRALAEYQKHLAH